MGATNLLFDVEQGLSLLFTQLTWPSGLVRERACVQIARLLIDSDYGDATSENLLQWMRSQRLESVNALGLVTLLRARLDNSDFGLPSFEELVAAVVKPSLLSALLFHELAPHEPDQVPHSIEYSGETPNDFSADPFFGKHVKKFLAPYFDFLAGLIEEGEVIAFRRHWAFEWKRLIDETGVKLTDRTLYFWFGSSADEDRVPSTDTKLSEIYRSAFLRALAWAVSTDRLSPSAAMLFAAEACPVNLDLWNIKTSQKPVWFPIAEESIGTIDVVPGEIWPLVEQLWTDQLNNSSEWRIAETSGIVVDGESVYDLEIYGLFQKSHGSSEPRLEQVVAWSHDEVQLSAQFDGYLHFSGVIRQDRKKRWIHRFDDWSFAPAAGSLNANLLARWQYWRMHRRVWLPAPYLGERLEFDCSDESVNAYENGQIIAKWFDWVDGLTERCNIQLPMATGQCLTIRRKTIEEFAKSTGSSFCWVCRLTGHHRKDTFQPYKEVHDYREFGCTRIATT
jgi:hypothetical protein